MQLKPFLLDAWLDQYEHDIEFNLAASTGPTWTVNDILALADDETRHRFLNHNLVYSRPAGADSLREAIAEMQRVPVDAVQIVTGASEALVALMWLAAEPGASIFDCRRAHGMDDRARRPAPQAILDRARLFLDLQHHHRRNSFGNRNPQT